MDLGDALIDGLGISPRGHVALVGGGGKTTLMFALARAGRRRGWHCVAGTTTRVGRWQVDDPTTFLHAGEVGDKLVGCAPEEVDRVYLAGAADLLVVEADGSRGKVVKAPAAHEPVIGSTATHVVAVMGADALDRVIEDVAHRPMLVAALCGCSPYERLTLTRAKTLLTHERGGRQGVPPGAAFAVALTRVGPRQADLAARLVEALASDGVTTIVLPVLEPAPTVEP